MTKPIALLATAALLATSAKTCRGNGGVNVDPGTDIATHLNIVTSAPPGL